MHDSDPRFPPEMLTTFASRFLVAMGCSDAVAAEVGEHLIEADLAGVYSHGIVRLPQYREQARDGRFQPGAEAQLTTADGGAPLVDGNNGFGIPALRIATETAVSTARKAGVAAVGVGNVAHTGRIGAFAEWAADQGCLAIILGGGSRHDWRQVAPYGGARAMLPTNPYAFSVPAGADGPVTLDFATSAGAGGKIYAARDAGRALPEGLCIDASGRPTTDPEDYFNGGALLPMAGPKGYGMALIAELLGEAMMGDARDGLNWLVVAIDIGRFRAGEAYVRAAESCLTELRDCPPAPGYARVEIPGERERKLAAQRRIDGVPLAPGIIANLKTAARELGLSVGEDFA